MPQISDDLFKKWKQFSKCPFSWKTKCRIGSAIKIWRGLFAMSMEEGRFLFLVKNWANLTFMGGIHLRDKNIVGSVW